MIWFAAGAAAIVWLVFRDAAMDYRLVAVGALVADPLDALVTRGVLHTLLFSVGFLGVVMAVTRTRRSLRRRLLALPIGTLLHLVLDGAWAATERFWWPGFGTDLGFDVVPHVERGAAVVIGFEVAGLVIARWLWRTWGLDDADRRSMFWRTGRLDRAHVGGPVH